MAYIHKITTNKGTTRWQCRWSVPIRAAARRERSKNFATQKEAKAHAVQMAEIESRGVGDPRKHDLAGYLRGWLAHLREREDLAPTTLERNVAIASHHIGRIALEKLAPLDLDRLYTTLMKQGGAPRKYGKPPRPLSRRSALQCHRVLHTALEQARKWKLIAHNPAADATPPSVPHKKARGYTEDEIARMLKAAEDDPEGYCVLALLLTTGIRRSELLGLGLDTVDLDRPRSTSAAPSPR